MSKKMDFLQVKSVCTQFQDVAFREVELLMFRELAKFKRKQRFNTRILVENITVLRTYVSAT